MYFMGLLIAYCKSCYEGHDSYDIELQQILTVSFYTISSLQMHIL